MKKSEFKSILKEVLMEVLPDVLSEVLSTQKSMVESVAFDKQKMKEFMKMDDSNDYSDLPSPKIPVNVKSTVLPNGEKFVSGVGILEAYAKKKSTSPANPEFKHKKSDVQDLIAKTMNKKLIDI